MATVQQEKCPSDFTCSISLELMEDPVILVQSGMTYEKKELQHALIEKPDRDPLTNAIFEGEAMIVPNHALRGALTAYNASILGRSTNLNR